MSGLANALQFLFGATTPLRNGTAAVGSSAQASRADHVHPSDTSRLAAASNLSDVASASAARSNLGAFQVLAGATATYYGSGQTLYLGANGAQQYETQTNWLAIGAGQVTRMTVKAVDAAPGTGQSYSYTLMKNGAATSLSVTLSGATQAGSAAGAISYVESDTLDIRLVTSSGADNSGHAYSLALIG